MNPFNAKRLLGRLAEAARHLTETRQREFTCSDCERYDRCGLAPDDACVIRLTQMARNSQSRYLSPRSQLVDDLFLKAGL